MRKEKSIANARSMAMQSQHSHYGLCFCRIFVKRRLLATGQLLQECKDTFKCSC